MSVINQMLNQLEARRDAEEGAADAVAPVPPPAQERAWLKWSALVVVSLLAGGGINWALKTRAAESAPAPEVSVNGTASGVTAEVAPPLPSLLTIAVAPELQLSFELSSVPLPTSPLPEVLAAETAADPAALPEVESAAPPAASPVAVAGDKPHAVPPVAEKPAPAHAKVEKQAVAQERTVAAGNLKRISPAQQSDAEFRRAASLLQQGKPAEAQAGYEQALKLDPANARARQALVALLLELKRPVEAEQVLERALKRNPEDAATAMLLARLQVERGVLKAAIQTLEAGLLHADERADFHAFYAALLQRDNRHKEAVIHYQIALNMQPRNSLWQMGFGLSLQALDRLEDAQTAYQIALETGGLSSELQRFVQVRLAALKTAAMSAPAPTR